MLCYARVFMVCFVIVSKKGGEKGQTLAFFHSFCTQLLLVSRRSVIVVTGYWFVWGRRSFFVVVVVSSSLHQHKKQNSCPTRRHLRILFSIRRTDRYTAVSNSIGSRENSTTAGKTFESSISPSAAKREKERKFSKKEIERRER